MWIVARGEEMHGGMSIDGPRCDDLASALDQRSRTIGNVTDGSDESPIEQHAPRSGRGAGAVYDETPTQ